ALAPVVPTTRAELEAAANSAAGLEDNVAEMRWMHPLYAPLRDAMEDPRFSENQRRQLWTNLARVRAIPAMPARRHGLVDAANARGARGGRKLGRRARGLCRRGAQDTPTLRAAARRDGRSALCREPAAAALDQPRARARDPGDARLAPRAGRCRQRDAVDVR